ncbi:hypothetical protein GCM10009116_11950 [Brevundimonas basaltis]|uniref:Uncharacterized protein n=1 Tax=Brevundimonas basaltis TaxID=472166 RepID=A0A7W8HX04_9CAUL|nr:hypothetical protein [Brevundimonas basaltis]MBB5290633.1 hypothetical protein [Brevundimonas basaltis]
MSAFEYTSVLASIIIGLALVDILVSLNRLIRAGRTVQWHWAAPVAAVFVVLTLIQIWWSLYRPDDSAITIGQFLPLFVELVILFLLAAAALPDDVPAEGIDLKAYYHRNGPYFWGLFTAALGWLLLVDVVENALNGLLLAYLGERIFDFAVLGVFASLVFVRRLWWHAIAILLLSSGPIGWLSRSLG